MKKKAIISLVLVAMLAFGIGAGSFAWFTSQATSANNVFAAGTLVIGLPDEGTTQGVFAVDKWEPGKAEAKTIEVKNLGTLPYKYRVSASMVQGQSAELYNLLDLEIKNGDEVEFTGKLKDLLNKEISTDVASGAIENLSFKVTFPSSAGNEYQGLTTKVNFVFDAAQTLGEY